LFVDAGHRTVLAPHSIHVRSRAPSLRGRRGLLFVGAIMAGSPNEDGLLWLAREVLPLLGAEALPVSVVGICKSEKVSALPPSHVRLLGLQDSLEPLYDAARVFVAPTRYAGGVPAKVIEAAAAGLPVVASSILVRQLGWRDGVDVVGARDAARFAAGIRALLRDDMLWERMQVAAWETCASRYDPALFTSAVRSAVVSGGIQAHV
jgi:glycosyltransferase involved in cell wall biosynthesis